MLQPRPLSGIHLLLPAVYDVDILLIRQVGRFLHILSHGTAVQPHGDNGLGVLTRYKVHKIPGLLHMAAALYDTDAVRRGDNPLLHIHQLYRPLVRHIVGGRLLKGKAHGVFSTGHPLVHLPGSA